MEILKWIESWFSTQCDGEWEHENQLQIYTVSNPGWSVQIDLNYTIVENLVINYELVETNTNDWYGLAIENKTFKASGDPSKLEFLLTKFRDIVENCEL